MILLRWETSHYTWQAAGDTEEQARAALTAMWADWCQCSGADERLLTDFTDDIQVCVLEAGAAYRDWEPYQLPAPDVDPAVTPCERCGENFDSDPQDIHTTTCADCEAAPKTIQTLRFSRAVSATRPDTTILGNREV